MWLLVRSECIWVHSCAEHRIRLGSYHALHDVFEGQIARRWLLQDCLVCEHYWIVPRGRSLLIPVLELVQRSIGSCIGSCSQFRSLYIRRLCCNCMWVTVGRLLAINCQGKAMLSLLWYIVSRKRLKAIDSAVWSDLNGWQTRHIRSTFNLASIVFLCQFGPIFLQLFFEA